MPSIALAKTFFSSLAKLEQREQSLSLAFVQKFMEEHVRQGTRLERITKARIPNLWSGRVNQELRAILYQEGDTYFVLYVGHHDSAYAWAERRQIHQDEQNRIQIIETRERAVEVEVPVHVAVAPGLFESHSDVYLTSLGVPSDWLPAIREVRDEDQLLSVGGRLPEEVAELLLDVASGRIVTPPAPAAQASVIHAEAGRRYYVVQDQDDLARALEGSLDDWMLFLHPEQRQIVEGVYAGPAHVIGAAGTGKTVVAIHRARELARREASVLLATFTRSLADNLARSIGRLCSAGEREKIEVSTLHSQALRLARTVKPDLAPLTDDALSGDLSGAASDMNSGIPLDILLSEWKGVIRPAGINEWGGYRDVSRVGRGRPLQAAERFEIWSTVARARKNAWQRGELDWAGICSVAARALTDGKVANPFQAVLVDEIQDLGLAELRLLRALAQPAPGNLMLFGDAGQRIYGRRTEIQAAGIDVSGRVLQLRTNYRTTESIRKAADAALGEISEGPRDSRSLLRGPPPTLHGSATIADERSFLSRAIEAWLARGVHHEDIAILSRTDERLSQACTALEAQGVKTCRLLDDVPGAIRTGTLHSAKGLEFRAVAVVGCEEETMPLEAAILSVSDPLDGEVRLEQERHLLYVGMTRAREELAVSWVGRPSRWIVPLI